MSADVLREAARLMRERAMHACPDGAWYDRHDLHEALTPVADSLDDPEADAEHIASWHPAVALAVADWLDGVAKVAEYNMKRMCAFYGEEHGPKFVANIPPDALAVARTYLGGAS